MEWPRAPTVVKAEAARAALEMPSRFGRREACADAVVLHAALAGYVEERVVVPREVDRGAVALEHRFELPVEALGRTVARRRMHGVVSTNDEMSGVRVACERLLCPRMCTLNRTQFDSANGKQSTRKSTRVTKRAAKGTMCACVRMCLVCTYIEAASEVQISPRAKEQTK